MILKRMRIKTVLGELTNCYVILDEESKEVMVVDPAGDADEIVEMINIVGGKLKYIYLTHCHGDHIAGVMKLKEKAGGKILIHREDSEGLNLPEVNLSEYIGVGHISLDVDSRVDHEDLIHLGNLEFTVIHTPGHTKGSSCLYCKEENFLISGDTLFRGTWGRTDLPTSSFEDIMDSIVHRLMILPEETIVYPGHGNITMIKQEKPIYLELRPREI